MLSKNVLPFVVNMILVQYHSPPPLAKYCGIIDGAFLGKPSFMGRVAYLLHDNAIFR